MAETQTYKNSGTRKGMTMRLLQDVGAHKESQNKIIDITVIYLVCNLQIKSEKPGLWNAIYRHANFMTSYLYSLLILT